jgi:uncharacterized OB-fold protein
MSQKKQMEDFMKQVEAFVEEAKKATGLPIIPEQRTGAALWFDQRSLTLRYTISVERLKPFFQGLAEGKVLATRCKRCGRVYFPPQADCPHCKASDMEWVEIKDEGELLTYTVIYTKPASFAHYPDYAVGVAYFKDPGVNVLAWISENDPKKLRVGMKVRLKVVRRQPENYLTYELVPVEEAGGQGQQA